MRDFHPGWSMTIAVLVMLPVLVGLGYWQLERAAGKRALERGYFEQLGAPPSPPPQTLTDADFLRVRLTGEYRPERYYLVDNQVRNGRPGYWVVSRFLADDGRDFLVNRGWVPAPERRDTLPAVDTPPGRVELVGVVWPDTGLPPLLAPDVWPEQWPKRVQRLDVERMAAEDGGAVDAEIRLVPGQAGVFDAAPAIVDFNPERHQGYAVQWFGLAATLAVGYLVFGFRKP